ncbi:putative NRPS-like protein biosynthetic cluster [Purpureocillium takamizusanense]|uniref:NRPS-like protein biosynthetic cluster n=1 Tax=Purpureocillium takamizusanense TaxID=2060973 RepID=A0A9Q8QG11_9HYPO|nr:putative NRPS-like protein biosynthetic cluster [Purpureocillium takamizusanense]UNI20184.1 putative NRPS-like protein biosynthetic cluster [Purpureocillium takamizusanense]
MQQPVANGVPSGQDSASTAPSKGASITESDLDKIWGWNSIVPAAEERCVHEMIQHQAQARPSAPAVHACDGNLTYYELDRLATVLADKLVDLGVKPNTFVPLCFEKSLWTTVAMLGVMKAGGAFVLLDPSLPEQRLLSMVREANARLLVSSAGEHALASRLCPDTLVVDHGFFRETVDHPSTRRLPDRDPNSFIYLVFTSGTTGAPKGAIITHKSSASGLQHQIDSLRYTTESRVYDFSAYSFDISIYSALTTLVAGGCLCVPSEQDRKSSLAGSIKSLRANTISLTPSVARLLSPDELPQLKTMILGGEALHVGDIEPWWGRVFTAYGPSECTPTSMINPHPSSLGEACRLGRGFGVVTWVVDDRDHNVLLPAGCVGELLLEGPLVGTGYLNDPKRTTAAFIEDPVWLLRGSVDQPGRRGRLYKTGDLVRYAEDGSLVFVGRNDLQVKIRGQRVELGEVETAVRMCVPEAKQVVAEVVTPAKDDASPALAVFVRMGDSSIAESGLSMLSITQDSRRRLEELLPSYMVPTAFFSIREMPMTPTGKTNRRRLREMGASFCEEAGETADTTPGGSADDGAVILKAEQPAYALAQKVAAMLPPWRQRDVAANGESGYEDICLFPSGLDSINMMALAYFISQQFQVEVDLEVLMDPSTSIRTLAGVVTDLQAAS